MKYSSGAKRSIAWSIDFLVLASTYLILSRIIFTLIPETNIEEPFDSMQLYTERERKSHFLTFSLLTIIVIAYQLYFPLTKWQGSIGHRIAGIKVVQSGGAKLTLLGSLRRFGITLFKCILVFFAGPVMAELGHNAALSLIVFLGTLGFFVVSFLVALKKPEKAWIWERLGNYRFVDRKP